jgi:hypothetical protein
MDRTAVWARLRHWRREGFWDGFEVHPNIAIFDVGAMYAEFQVADAAEGWALFDKLDPVEGLLGASFHNGDSVTTRNVDLVAVVMVAEDHAGIDQRMRRLRSLAPTGIVNGPFPIETPPCSRELTPLDWRILAAIFSSPDASPSQTARLVGVTRKTFVRHHSAMIDDRVVSYAPRVDWSKLGCVTLGIYCRAAEDVDRVREALDDHFPHRIPMSLEGFGTIAPEYNALRCFGMIVPARSPHELPKLVRDLSQLDGVRMVRPELWGPSRQYPRWMAQRIAEHLATSSVLRPNVVPPVVNRKGDGHAAPGRPESLVLPAH